jgi:uncharacterized membrane protein YjjP (DUF1212 family)
MSGNDLLRYALDIGEQMLISGAEVSRVEDTISRICKAYQVKRVDVFSITSNIIVTIQTEDETLTQTRRIHKSSTNLVKLDRLNSLSRYICTNTPELTYIGEQLSLLRDNKYGPRIQYLIFAMISGSFTVFFGGSLRDGAVSALIGMLSKSLIQYLQRAEKNAIFNNFLCSFLIGCLTVLSVRMGIVLFSKKLPSVILCC